MKKSLPTEQLLVAGVWIKSTAAA